MLLNFRKMRQCYHGNFPVMRSFHLSSASSLLSLTLTLALIAPPPLGAQVPSQGSAPAPAPAKPQESLKVFVLEGQGAVNFIPDQRAHTPVVEVRDENDMPVEGASVVFELPESGPGGQFPGGGRSMTVKTVPGGQAAAPFTVNQQAGPFQIKVTATIGDKIGRAVISQTNSLTPPLPAQNQKKKSRWLTTRKLVLLSSAAAAAILVAVLVTRDSGSSKPASASAPPPTIIISPGSPTFGGPR